MAGRLKVYNNAAGAWQYLTTGGPGVELAYNEFTSTVSPTATTEATANTVVTASSVTFDGSTRVDIIFSCPHAKPDSGASARSMNIWLYEDGTSIGRLASLVTPAAADSYSHVHAVYRYTPTNGSHTFSVRASVSAGTGSLVAGAGGNGNVMPGYIRIVTS